MPTSSTLSDAQRATLARTLDRACQLSTAEGALLVDASGHGIVRCGGLGGWQPKTLTGWVRDVFDPVADLSFFLAHRQLPLWMLAWQEHLAVSVFFSRYCLLLVGVERTRAGLCQLALRRAARSLKAVLECSASSHVVTRAGRRWRKRHGDEDGHEPRALPPDEALCTLLCAATGHELARRGRLEALDVFDSPNREQELVDTLSALVEVLPPGADLELYERQGVRLVCAPAGPHVLVSLFDGATTGSWLRAAAAPLVESVGEVAGEAPAVASAPVARPRFDELLAGGLARLTVDARDASEALVEAVGQLMAEPQGLGAEAEVLCPPLLDPEALGVRAVAPGLGLGLGRAELARPCCVLLVAADGIEWGAGVQVQASLLVFLPEAWPDLRGALGELLAEQASARGLRARLLAAADAGAAERVLLDLDG